MNQTIFYKIPNQLITIAKYHPYVLATYIQCLANKPLGLPYKTTIGLIESDWLRSNREKNKRPRGKKDIDFLNGLISLSNAWKLKNGKEVLEPLFYIPEYDTDDLKLTDVTFEVEDIFTISKYSKKVMDNSAYFYRDEINVELLFNPGNIANNFTILTYEDYLKLLEIGQNTTNKKFNTVYLALIYLYIKQFTDRKTNLIATYVTTEIEEETIGVSSAKISRDLNMVNQTVVMYLGKLIENGLVKQYENGLYSIAK